MGAARDAQRRQLRALTCAIALLKRRDLASSLVSLAAELRELLDLDDLDIEVGPDAGLERVNGASPPLSGTRFALPLERDGRIVGIVRGRARGGVTLHTVDALAKVCDLLAVAIDDDRLLRQEQELAARQHELDEMKSIFLASVSHEFRTTVTAIEGFSMLLSRQWSTLEDEQRADFVRRIRRHARVLGALVEDLLDHARLSGAAMPLVLEPLDLSELSAKVVLQLSPVLERHTVTTAIEPGVVSPCDPGALERILVHLLSNAAKYAPPGTEVCVCVRADACTGIAVLAVSDRGAGVPPAERERIFERFYRIGDDARRAARGVGIGLSLARDLVRLQGGTIAVGDTPGGGATFTVTLPLADRSPIEHAVDISDTSVPEVLT